MNWNAIGAVAELVGASGVIASLLYLAVQIRQSTKQSIAEQVPEKIRQINLITALTMLRNW